MFIEPMYACPLPNKEKNPKAKDFILEPGRWIAEEKYDGIRVTTEISDTSDQLFIDKGVTSWSRYGNIRKLPEHIMEELAQLPNCYIDGELIAPGKRSYGTMEIANAPDLKYFIFDILRYDLSDVTDADYNLRRDIIRTLIDTNKFKSVKLAPALHVDTWEDVYALRDEVWSRDGEGLILKRKDSIYIPGRRPKNTWIKIKKLQSAVFTVTGFIPSRGLINDRGPYAMVQLADEEGNITAVKTKNDAQCRLFEERARIIPHPDIGRKLWCEFQERTPDKSYRHIRWDHWDGE